MQHTHMHVLLVENNPADIHTIWNMLHEKSSFTFSIETVNKLPEAEARLKTDGVDVVLLDLALVTHLEETDAVATIVAIAPQVAIVVLTELQNEQAGLRALEGGAQDYLLKEELGVRILVRALHYAVERKHAHEQVRVAEVQLQATMDSIRDYAIVTTNDNGLITSWSIGSETLFGYPSSEMIGKHTSILYTADDQREGIPEQMHRRILEGAASELDRWFVRKDSSRFFASGLLFPLPSATKQGAGFTMVVRDTTSSKLLEEQRRELLKREQTARAEAEETLRFRQQFLAIVAHELRTPLTSIKGFASTLLAEDVSFDPATWQHFIQIIDEEASKMGELIDNLFDVVRIQNGLFNINAERTNLQRIWTTALAQVTVLTQAHELVVDLPANLPPLMADIHRVAQVFTNLIDNAAKFAPAHSPITVKAKQVGEQLEVTVSNLGTSIAAADRQKIFDAFRQGRETNRNRNKGAGLGLAICKGIIEAHGGHIWIQDNDTPETIFVFTLPVME
jgi:PAS domain S-box-containing protein